MKKAARDGRHHNIKFIGILANIKKRWYTEIVSNSDTNFISLSIP